MLNFIEHLTNERYLIGLYCYDIAPYDDSIFYKVIK